MILRHYGFRSVKTLSRVRRLTRLFLNDRYISTAPKAHERGRVSVQWTSSADWSLPLTNCRFLDLTTIGNDDVNYLQTTRPRAR